MHPDNQALADTFNNTPKPTNDESDKIDWHRDPADPYAEKVSPEEDTLAATLAQRGSRYGDFAGHAKITQELKFCMQAFREGDGWQNLNDSQREALEMIVHKIGRILNGDPNYDDSWHDIAGYAELIVKQLIGKPV